MLLEPLPPFRLDLTAWALRRRPTNIVDRWDGETYRRVIQLGGEAVEIAVVQTGPADAPELRVDVAGLRGRRQEVAAVLERLLGLRTSLDGFYALAADNPGLSALAERFRGVKPPRFTTVFESLVNGIACQQLSLNVGIILLNRLAENFGPMAGGAYGFPTPAALKGQDPERLRALGFSRQKAKALLALAEVAVNKAVDLDGTAALGDEDAKKRLLALRGVGRWTAEYAMLRGLGRTHVFPGDDVGARNGLTRWLGRSRPLDYQDVQRILVAWQPYAGMVYFHLLLQSLEDKGYLAPPPDPRMPR
ncbi:MAG TPA: hypothetical protein PKC12_06035 [Thiobacillaceae bacterium]|nr:hypothetical protein [Thiobacillaceae bacterium]